MTTMPEMNRGWVRLPVKPGERLEGLSRAHLYGLIRTGQIRTACLRQPGATTGVRLIYLPSLLEYIERHIEEHADRVDTGSPK